MPKGASLLTQLPAGKLKGMCRKGKCRAKADRIRAYIRHKRGKEISAIAAELDAPYTTAYRWLLGPRAEGPLLWRAGGGPA